MQILFDSNQIVNSHNLIDSQKEPIGGASEQAAQSIFQETFKQISDEFTDTQEGLHLLSNESKQVRTCKIMKQQKVMHEALLAVSGFFGLDIASMRGEDSEEPINKLSYLIFIDVNRRVQKFWTSVSKIICQSSNEHQTLKNFEQTFKANAEVLWLDHFGKTAKEWADYFCECLRTHVKAGNSWLSTSNRFKIIQQIFQEKRFIFKAINLCDKEAMKKLCQIVRGLNFKFDTVYLSNVKEYADTKFKLLEFQEAVGELSSVVSNETLFIDTINRIGGVAIQMEDLKQRVTINFLNYPLDQRFPSAPLPPIYSLEFKTSIFSKYKKLFQSKKIRTIAQLAEAVKSAQQVGSY